VAIVYIDQGLMVFLIKSLKYKGFFIMSDDFSFHPALIAQRLTLLQKNVVNLIATFKREVTQGELLRKINNITDDHRAISQATLSRAMAVLCEMEVIEKLGVSKNARFRLIPGADYFIKPPQRRPKVGFDVTRLTDYVPNTTQWLEGASLERMHEAVEVAKKRHVKGAAASRRAAERFLIDLSWASSSMEGSTYEYLDTVALINYGEKLADGRPEDRTLILNHKRAISFMMESINEKKPFTADFISQIHAILMRDILDDDQLGVFRDSPVGITASAYEPTIDVRIIKASIAAIVDKINKIEDPCEASIFILNSLSYLQAFHDGNKRTARLLANVPLLQAGYPPLSFVDVDKTSYLAGLIAFYEVGDLRLINSTVAAAYELHAPTYEAAIIAPKMTRTVEMRERPRIDNCISILATKIANNEWAENLLYQMPLKISLDSLTL
jgi:fido (protein-threonine AMPylation protein)